MDGISLTQRFANKSSLNMDGQATVAGMLIVTQY